MGDKSDIQDHLHAGKDSEWDRSRDDNDGLVNSQSDLLGGSEQEVLELGAIEDEEHHREGNSDDLNDQEHHDALRS